MAPATPAITRFASGASGDDGQSRCRTSSRATPDPKQVEYEHQIALAQARWLELSSNARQISPPQSSEYVEFDQPEAVVSAIREVYDQSK